MNQRKRNNGRSNKDVLAGKIARWIVQQQLVLSRTLSGWEKKLNGVQKKWLFLAFAGIAGVYCSFLLIAGLFGTMEPRSRHSGKAVIVPVDTMRYRNLQLPSPRTVNAERGQNKHQKQQ